MAPLELTGVWEYSKEMTINIMILVFWSITWLILTNDKICCDMHIPCYHI